MIINAWGCQTDGKWKTHYDEANGNKALYHASRGEHYRGECEDCGVPLYADRHTKWTWRANLLVEEP